MYENFRKNTFERKNLNSAALFYWIYRVVLIKIVKNEIFSIKMQDNEILGKIIDVVYFSLMRKGNERTVRHLHPKSSEARFYVAANNKIGNPIETHCPGMPRGIVEAEFIFKYRQNWTNCLNHHDFLCHSFFFELLTCFVINISHASTKCVEK